MPLPRYGVIKGYVLDCRHAHIGNPHFQILINADGVKYRASVNAKSNAFPSELLYLAIDNFEHPMTDMLEQLPIGYSDLPRNRDSGALDYIRANLFDAAQMHKLPFDKPGPDNDLNEKLDAYMQRAAKEIHVHPETREAHYPVLYAIGEPWGPERISDKIFGFLPGNGIHNIHMNQGNMPKWQRDDAIWQDGGLIIYYPAREQWTAIFLAFQTQSFHTDDGTGRRLLRESRPEHPEPEPLPGIPARVDKPTVRIVAAMVDPFGDDTGKEYVTLKNVTRTAINLNGWTLVDKQRMYESLPAVEVAAGKTVDIHLSGANMQLSNKGGTITLLNPEGIKIHGVAYSKHRVAQRTGKVLKF
jgi:uncharacterized protein YukJ